VVLGLNVTPATRHHLEERFAADFQKAGVQAAASYAVLGDELPDRDITQSTLAAGGYDGVLVLRLHRVDEQARYVPSDRFYGAPYTNYWGPSGYSYSPGYYVTDEIVKFETSLWDLRDGKRVWTANTKTTNPSSSADIAKSLSKKLIPELAEKGLVARTGG
jgi:hypothetical protein